MGFGSGPFGSFPFGSWPWGKEVLFELLPQLYKAEDAEEGDVLQRYSEALAYSFNNIKEKIDNFDNLRDPFTVQTQYTTTSSLLLGKIKQAVSEPEQQGINAFVTSLGEVVCPTARFSEHDQGKELIISGSSIPANNKKVTIFFAIDGNTVTTDPILAVDAGLLRWELRTPEQNDEDAITVEVRGGDLSPVGVGWVLSDGSAEFDIIGRKMFTTYGEGASYLNEQEGADGAVINLSGSGGFTAPSANFVETDVGKRLVLLGPEYPAEQNVFITRIVSTTQVAVTPTLDLSDGPFTWALLPWGELTLSGKATPKGTVEQDGLDLQITAADPSSITLFVPSAVFTASDVGKYITWRKLSDADNTTQRITAVLTSTTVTTTQRALNVTVDAGPFLWELRSATATGPDLVSVEAHTPSHLAVLSQDFAIEVDSQESEIRQRRWVAHCGQWMDTKGTEESYEIIGKVSGADITVEQLYRVSATSAPPGAFEVLEVSGTSGTLSVFSLRYRFSAPTATFTVADVGKTLKVTGAATGGNNKYYTIDSIISATQVEFIAADIATLPDANNGSLSWSLVRLYTALPPLRPRFDDINSDILSTLVTAENGVHKEFVIDAFCWEDDFSTTVAAEITAVSTIALNEHAITIRGATSPIAPEVVVREGRWVLTSMDGVGVPLASCGISGTAPNMTFTAVSPMFTASDVGKYLRIDTSGNPVNEGVFLITSFVSPSVVTYFNGIGTAETVTGTFYVYTPTDYFLEEVPTRIGTVASNYAGAGDSISDPGTDNFCVLTDAAASFGTDVVGQFIRITGTTNPLNTGLFEVTERPSSTSLKFHNISATVGVAETSPFAYTIGFPLYTTSVKASIAPDVGPAKLTYECSITPSCDYCASYRLRVTIAPKDELFLEGTAAVERLFERIERRLREVTPAHVELVLVQITSLRGAATATATAVGNIFVGLAGSMTGIASTVGDIDMAFALAGAPLAAAITAGDADVAYTVTGAPLAVASTVGDIDLVVAAAGSVTAVAAVTGDITVTPP